MFVIGVLYLTSDFYQYTFSAFNPTVVSGILVPFGVVISILALSNIVCLQILLCRDGNKYNNDYDDVKSSSKFTFFMGILITFCSGFILILFIILLAIGIWGLVIYSNNSSLTNEVNNNLINSIRNYIINGDNDQTKGMDWVQDQFDCCGIDSYADWNSYLNSFGMQPPFGLGYYKCFLPTSCCIEKTNDCLNKYYIFCNGYNGLIHSSGCLKNFMSQLNKDILFLSAFCVSVSSFGIVLWIINIILFILCRL